MALFSHWFLSYIGPKKKPGVEETFEDVLFPVSSSFHHSHSRVKFSKARQRKSEAIIEFKEQPKTFYEQSYGPRRPFSLISDAVL